ncbi:MAG TPA: hypothetical protein VMS08_00440 [Candidatus Saccharimonadia bacterium]|nr:hypothetical protein [Candidatus Saccharimonadia bacterium]
MISEKQEGELREKIIALRDELREKYRLSQQIFVNSSSYETSEARQRGHEFDAMADRLDEILEDGVWKKGKTKTSPNFCLRSEPPLLRWATNVDSGRGVLIWPDGTFGNTIDIQNELKMMDKIPNCPYRPAVPVYIDEEWEKSRAILVSAIQRREADTDA